LPQGSVKVFTLDVAFFDETIARRPAKDRFHFINGDIVLP
jgi:hypothetical protein